MTKYFLRKAYLEKMLRTLEVTTAAKCGSVKSAEIRPGMKIKDSDAVTQKIWMTL